MARPSIDPHQAVRWRCLMDKAQTGGDARTMPAAGKGIDAQINLHIFRAYILRRILARLTAAQQSHIQIAISVGMIISSPETTFKADGDG